MSAQVIRILVGRPLTPKRTEGDLWAPASFVERMNTFAGRNNAAQAARVDATLEDLLDAIPDVARLRYEFEDEIRTELPTLDDNTQIVLSDSYPAIRVYLIAYGFFVRKRREIYSLKDFVLNVGPQLIAEYATKSAARTRVATERLDVEDLDDDNGDFVTSVGAGKFPLTSPGFDAAFKSLRTNLIFNSRELRIIERSGISVPPSQRAQVVAKIRAWRGTIRNNNVGDAKFVVALSLSQLAGDAPADPSGYDGEYALLGEASSSDEAFRVVPFTDDAVPLQASRSSVRCAAQLFYAMTLGDELEIFNVVKYFTHKYLLRESLEIHDPQLREDLQRYVFSNQFVVTDPTTRERKVRECTRPAERMMFHRQVFNAGQGDMVEDIVVNEDFPRLWKVLMLETARYIQRTADSPNPDSRVSPQSMMQAVEDLQYNLSIHCAGMATVVTPLIYDELDFVTRRILMHREVRQQLVPQGGSWWKAVERLYAEMKGSRPRATILNNKAMGGYEIISSIAEYNPATFALRQNLDDFVSKVDAFIITQSILQESLTHDLKGTQSANAGPPPPELKPVGAGELVKAGAGSSPTGNGNGAHDGEWDF